MLVVYLWYWCLRCAWHILTGAAFNGPLEAQSWDSFPILKLNLILALFDVFQVVNDDSSSVCAHCDCAAIHTKLDLCHEFSFWKCDLLIWILITRAILIDVNLFDFFPHRDIVKMNFPICATWSEEQMIDLRKSNAGARLSLMWIENKLFATSSQSHRILGEDAVCIPYHDLAVLVRRCQDVPFDHRKLHLRYCASFLAALKMLKNHFTGSTIMPSIVHFKSTIDGRPFLAQHIPYRDIAIDISRNDHGIIGIETNASATQKWFFVNPIELLSHHINHDQMPAIKSLMTALRSDEGYLWAVCASKSGIENLGGILGTRWSKLADECVLLGNDLSVGSFAQHKILVDICNYTTHDLI